MRGRRARVSRSGGVCQRTRGRECPGGDRCESTSLCSDSRCCSSAHTFRRRVPREESSTLALALRSERECLGAKLAELSADLFRIGRVQRRPVHGMKTLSAGEGTKFWNFGALLGKQADGQPCESMQASRDHPCCLRSTSSCPNARICPRFSARTRMQSSYSACAGPACVRREER